ncbi:hypothetical protein [Methylobacterium soli]|uniref:hypothetical protein n=1 Tax=Methylobacterium soli TaxID=553447 RepID=UPI00177B0A86|nr:hypothetical protein [Methylobacterium soli]GJE41332.1 hypothetical protein AEGHOMDF_0496 [Methylobacterium soli]
MEATGLFALQDDVRSCADADERILAAPAALADPNRVVLGVDPGASGALAFYRPARPHEILVFDAPLADGQIDGAELGRLIRDHVATAAIVERVSAMPKQGVSSTSKFGMAYGAVLGALGALHIPFRLETPARWKKHFRLSSDKEQSRALAIRTWPASRDFARKKDDGRAEAALLALYACEVVR